MPSVYIFKSYIPYQWRMLQISKMSLTMYELQVSDLSAKYNQAVADHKKRNTNAMKALEKECEKLAKQVEELHNHLE
jgi:phage shock protein A